MSVSLRRRPRSVAGVDWQVDAYQFAATSASADAVPGRVARVRALVGATAGVPPWRVVLAAHATQRDARTFHVQVAIMATQSAQRLTKPYADAGCVLG